MKKEIYYIQVGEEDIIQGIDLSEEELSGVIRTLEKLHELNRCTVSIYDTYNNEHLCLGF